MAGPVRSQFCKKAISTIASPRPPNSTHSTQRTWCISARSSSRSPKVWPSTVRCVSVSTKRPSGLCTVGSGASGGGGSGSSTTGGTSASGSVLAVGVEGASEPRLVLAVLLCTQVGAGTRAGIPGPAGGGPGEAGGSGTTVAQLFTFNSSTSNTSAESGPMSRPAPRLP